MQCPSCNTNLIPTNAAGIEVEICKDGCKGLWFDIKELKAFDEEHEFNIDSLISASGEISKKEIKSCPKCADEVLAKRFYDINNHVQVEQCFNCSGIWLDAGELSLIRKQYKTEADRTKAADQYIDTYMTSTLESIEQKSDKRYNRSLLNSTFLNFMHRILS